MQDDVGHLRRGTEDPGNDRGPSAEGAVADLVREVAGGEQVRGDDDAGRPGVPQRSHRLGRARVRCRRVGGDDGLPAALAGPLGRQRRDRRVRRRVGRPGRREDHAGGGALGGGVDGHAGLPQPPLQGGQEERVRAEGACGDDVEARVGSDDGGQLGGDVALAVVGGGQQQRQRDAPGNDIIWRVARREGGQRLQQRRRAVVEERGPHVHTRSAVAHGISERGHRRRRARVLRPVRDGDERDQTCRPHSVLPVPVHRPERGSAPGSTRSVQVWQPIDG